MTNNAQAGGEVLLFRSDDGHTKVQVKFHDKTVWLSQRSISELYQVSVKTVNEHLINIYEEGELQPEATIRNFRIVQIEGKRKITRNVDHYNLEGSRAIVQVALAQLDTRAAIISGYFAQFLENFTKFLLNSRVFPTIGINGPQVGGITVNGSSTPFKKTSHCENCGRSFYFTLLGFKISGISYNLPIFLLQAVRSISCSSRRKDRLLVLLDLEANFLN